MNEETMKDLLYSLAWYDASAHHYRNAHEILKKHYPSTDFSETLDEFCTCKTMPPGEGCPR